MGALPDWLQWLVSISTVLSSVGVIVAFVQLRISSNQFKEQLRQTEQQFRLLNQGYINLTFNQGLFVIDPDGSLRQVDPDKITVFFATALMAVLENPGNMPIKFDVMHCIVYSHGTEIYRASETELSETVNTIYPKATQSFNFGTFYLGEAGVNLQQLLDLDISYDLLINYHDFNDEQHIKKINRKMALSGGQIMIRKNRDII
ncbi:MAG: hypothetical protein JWP37_2320 [Mucilaginibacter sp.]|nr:hypothetical protein [Mucilaginibacter sp.]